LKKTQRKRTDAKTGTRRMGFKKQAYVLLARPANRTKGNQLRRPANKHERSEKRVPLGLKALSPKKSIRLGGRCVVKVCRSKGEISALRST